MACVAGGVVALLSRQASDQASVAQDSVQHQCQQPLQEDRVQTPTILDW